MPLLARYPSSPLRRGLLLRVGSCTGPKGNPGINRPSGATFHHSDQVRYEAGYGPSLTSRQKAENVSVRVWGGEAAMWKPVEYLLQTPYVRRWWSRRRATPCIVLWGVPRVMRIRLRGATNIQAAIASMDTGMNADCSAFKRANLEAIVRASFLLRVPETTEGKRAVEPILRHDLHGGRSGKQEMASRTFIQTACRPHWVKEHRGQE